MMDISSWRIRKERQSNRSSYLEQPTSSWYWSTFNVLGCLFVSFVNYYVYLCLRMPLTLDTFFTILLAEYNRYSNESRRESLSVAESLVDVDSIEKGDSKSTLNEASPEPSCVATIIGYREDPIIFTKALESYKHAEKCGFVLVGVDGDGPDDQEMVGVFEEVYPDGTILHLEEPMADIAMRLKEKIQAMSSNEKAEHFEDTDAVVVAACCRMAREILDKNGVRLTGEGAVKRLCLSQPHKHKKGIMFTAFIYAIVICEALKIDFIWSSDSDSWITPDAIRRTVATVACDPNTAGASTALSIHNADENTITQLANAVYLSELYLARSMAGARTVNECQSGPCALFRATVLSQELIEWYKQTVMGHWMIVNEDRHLTTRLLLAGWKVTFVSDVITATDTPNTLRRWILQQVRWGRATIIETVYQPRLTLNQSPLLFLLVLRRVVMTVVVPVCIVVYLLTGKSLRLFEYSDVFQRAFWSFLYIALRNPYRGSFRAWCWIIPAQVFYNFPMPAIQLWSLVTVFSDRWEPPAASDKVRRHKIQVRLREMGFFIFWMGLSGGSFARLIADKFEFPDALLRSFTISAVFLFWIVIGGWAVLTEK